MNEKNSNLCLYYYKKRESGINASVAGSATGLDLLALFFLFLLRNILLSISKRARRGKVREERYTPPAMVLAVPFGYGSNSSMEKLYDYYFGVSYMYLELDVRNRRFRFSILSCSIAGMRAGALQTSCISLASLE